MKSTTNEALVPIGDLTPADPGSALSKLTSDDVWDGVDDGDLTQGEAGRIPLLRLNRKGDGTGGFESPDGATERVESIDFIWLARSQSRAQFDKPYNAKEAGAPDCRSFDGVSSDPASPHRKQEDCATCPFANWNNPDIAQHERCRRSTEAMVFLYESPDAGRLARIRFGGIAEAPARAYWDSFKTRLPRRPPIAFLSRATLEPVETDNGKFLRPRFERIAELPRADAQPLIEERDRRIADWKADIADSVSTASADLDETNGHGSEVWAEGEEPF